MVGRGKPVIAQPNAGLPASVEGRTLYVANPEHFGVFARRMLKSGVRLVGGCCGTTPEHTRAMLGAVRMLRGETTTIDERGQRSRRRSIALDRARARREDAARRAQPARRRGSRAASSSVSVELTAPTGLRSRQDQGSRSTQLLAGGVDIVNIADGPRASARMANVAVCARLAAETPVEPILHVCARDRSFLGLVAHLLGAQRPRAAQPRHHHRRSAEDGRLPVLDAGLRRRLGRPAADRRGPQRGRRSGRQGVRADARSCSPPAPSPPRTIAIASCAASRRRRPRAPSS